MLAGSAPRTVSQKIISLDFNKCIGFLHSACIGMLLIAFILSDTKASPKNIRASARHLFTWKENAVVCRNTFLKGTVMLRPAMMLNGPWALGGRQIPRKGKMYSPPIPEDRLSWPLTSPSWWGSKQTSTLASDPTWKPGEAATLLSTMKSGQSVCRREITRGGSLRLHVIGIFVVLKQ